jgi:hypothetical protein
VAHRLKEYADGNSSRLTELQLARGWERRPIARLTAVCQRPLEGLLERVGEAAMRV